ncbi:MAG: DUF3892 domain-containing protein [Betaproteobacteria bacterium]
MQKWADYLISAVRSGPTTAHIDSVEVHSDFGCVVCETLIVTRGEVIANLKKGCTYTTIHKTAMGKWRKGDDVCLVNVNGEVYIKAGANDCKPQDNFENVPEF